jgi:hypothetical protein
MNRRVEECCRQFLNPDPLGDDFGFDGLLMMMFL